MTSRTLLLIGLLAVLGPAQGESPKKPEPPRQDKAALALLDRADTLMYSNRGMGLKDLQYRHVLENLPGIWVAVKWMAPDKVSGKLTMAKDVAPAMKFYAQSMGKMLESTALGVVDMMTGQENRKVYAGDEIVLAGPRKVKIVARSERSRKIFQEHEISFDESGLPARTRSKREGSTIEMSVSFVVRDQGKYFVDKVESVQTAGGKKVQTTMRFTYGRQGAYVFPSRVDSVTQAGKTVMKFEDVRADQGLTAKDFE